MEIDLDKGLELVDLTTHQTVPYEVLSTGPDYHHVRFLAQDVPSVGYKAYAMKPAHKRCRLHPPAPRGRWRIRTTGWYWTPKAER